MKCKPLSVQTISTNETVHRVNSGTQLRLKTDVNFASISLRNFKNQFFSVACFNLKFTCIFQLYLKFEVNFIKINSTKLYMKRALNMHLLVKPS